MSIDISQNTPLFLAVECLFYSIFYLHLKFFLHLNNFFLSSRIFKVRSQTGIFCLTRAMFFNSNLLSVFKYWEIYYKNSDDRLPFKIGRPASIAHIPTRQQSQLSGHALFLLYIHPVTCLFILVGI